MFDNNVKECRNRSIYDVKTLKNNPKYKANKKYAFRTIYILGERFFFRVSRKYVKKKQKTLR